MALRTKGARLTLRGSLTVAALLLVWGPLKAQPVLTLEQASSRQLPDFSPAYAGQVVTVRGQVPSSAFHFPTYTLLAIQSERGGIVLQVLGNDKTLDAHQAGDNLEVTGTVSILAGLPVLLPKRIVTTGRSRAPVPDKVALAELQGFRHLGRLVEAEGRISEIGDATAGLYLLITDGGPALKIFVPNAPGRPVAHADGYSIGDKVRAAGVALQYCPRPPYNRWFELLVHETAAVARLERSWFVPPGVIAGAAGAILVALLVLWKRDRDLRAAAGAAAAYLPVG